MKMNSFASAVRGLGKNNPALLVLYAALAIVTAVISPSSASADVFNVTKTADTNDGVCDADCSLREAIVAANAVSAGQPHTINIPAGTYTITDTTNKDFDLTKSFNFVGAGSGLTIIDGNGATINDGVFQSNWGAGAVSMTGMTIRNGKRGSAGGCMDTANNVYTLTDVIVDSCQATGNGGGLYSNGATVNVSNSTFSNNTASSSGGGVYINNNTATVTSSTFDANHANGGNGGGVFAAQTVTVDGSGNVFSNNTATTYGGAIYTGTTMSVSNATISGNTAINAGTSRGGALYANGGGVSITITNCTINSNTADQMGGAAYTNNSISVTNSSFDGNEATASSGGALYAGAAITVNATSSFTNNTAGGYGGAIYAGNTTSIDGATIDGNSVGGSSRGGGLHVNAGGLVITNSTISNNTAPSMGGGIYANTTIDLTSSTVSGNESTGSSGGGLYSGGILTITDSTISNNTAASGGAGAQGGSSINVTRSTISGNSVTSGPGGGFLSWVSSITLSNSTLSGNTATTNGSGFYMKGCTVKNSTIYGNTGSSGVYSNAACTFTNTIIAGSGGTNCSGTRSSGGYNIEDLNTCGFASTGDLPNTDPLLNALADNGGPNLTHALQPTSPAVDTGDNTTCANAPISNVDQRGETRPADGDGDTTAICDIGSFEYVVTTTYQLDVTVSGSAGTVTSSPGTINCTTGTCSESFNSGTSVTLTATPDAGYQFDGWSGAGCSGTGTCVVTMDAAKSVTATFSALPQYQLDVTVSGSSGTVTSSPGTINCTTGTCSESFTSGTSVTLTATPDAGYQFDGWSGAGCSGTGTCVVTMDAAKSVTATFSIIQRQLDVTVSGSSGTVTSSPGTINCTTGTCSEQFDNGTSVTLTATPDAGYQFDGWSGAGCSGTGTCVVTMDAAKSVTATFSIIQRQLDVTVSGSAGTVTSSPGTINCTTGTCSEQFDNGTSVTLTATPDAGYQFDGWSGAGCSGTGTCVVTMDAAKSVTATFSALPQYQLDVTVSGSSGTVTSSPGTINCTTGTCSESFTSGTSVTLTATPDAGYQFDGWSGAGCSGTGTCVVTMDAAKSVTATFSALPQYQLDVTVSGSAGTVTSSPGTINCTTGTCSESFTSDTTVTLTATPDGGYQFDGWSGAGCSGTGTCVVTMDAAKSVTATFSILTTYQLNISITGSGSVTSHTGGIDCPAVSCSESTTTLNEIVTISATPDAGYQFDGWSGGGCSGKLPCNVTMDGVKTVTATFTSTAAETPQTFTVTKMNDTRDGACTPSDCSLREAIDAANANPGTDTINVPAGTYRITLSGAEENNATGDFDITESVNITGAGLDQTIIIGDGSERVFHSTVSGHSFSFSGVTIQDGTIGGDGGCISSQFSSVTVTDSKLTNCSAGNRGGAIYSSQITASGSTFSGNTSTGSGGALFSTSSVSITSSTFDTNIAGGLGGAAYANGGSIVVDGAGNVFTNNSNNSGDGGALYASTSISVSNAVMTGNQAGGASGRGGVMYSNGSGGLTVTNCVISDNTSVGSGGAMYSNGQPVIVTNSTLNNNTSTGGNGGAISTTSTVTINATSVLSGNSAPANGAGAVYAGGGFSATGATLSGNSAGYRGGAVYVNAGSTTITDSTVSDNTSVNVGGGLYAANNTTITNSVFSGNDSGSSSGGGMFLNGGVVTITGSTIKDNQNTGGGNGGGIYANSSINLINSTLSGNTAGNMGGGAYSVNPLVATNSTISGNTATSNAGGGFRGAGCTLKNVTFYGNSATSGGAFNIYSGCSITNTIIANNGASNCSGTSPTSNGFNIEDLNTCNFNQGSDQPNTDPLLNALSDNGGATMTHSLRSTSPAIDAGDNATCAAAPVSGQDQRGVARPQDGDADTVATCDIGAYEFEPYELNVVVTGSGSVTSTPGSIDCPGSLCAQAFSQGASVTLTATPTAGSGYVFDGWGGACAGTGPCNLTMDTAKNVTASFSPSATLFQLDVTVNGSGSVTSAPGSIDCPGTSCSGSFSDGTMVSLTAAPSAGYKFDGWSGVCSGVGTCDVTLDAAKSVTAAFSIITYQLDVTVAGYGTVTSSPGSINCSSGTCSEAFNTGTVVTLTAAPSSGYKLGGWSGACSGTGPCDVTMDAVKSVKASFTTYKTSGSFSGSEHGGVDATYPDRAYYPSTDGVTGVSRAHIDSSYNAYPRGECLHCHDWFNPIGHWPMLFTDYQTKETKVDFCGNCHTDTDPDANGIDNDTPDGFSFRGPSKYKNSAHYTRNLQWPGGQYGTTYPAMGADKQGTCVNCHSPHAHSYTSDFATIPSGVSPDTVPYPKQLVELTDIVDGTDTLTSNWPSGWPNVNGRDPDDAEDLCYTCHDGDPVQNPDLTTYNKYMKYGEAAEPDVTSIKAAFDESFHHPVKDSEQIAIEVAHGTTIQYKVECTTCHNPHLASGKWDDFAAGSGTPTPVVLPGVSWNWPPSEWGLDYEPGELWGDDPEEKLNALLERIASDREDARGTGGWQFNVDRGYPYEQLDVLPFDQPPVYRPPLGGPGPGKGYQPDGDKLPDFLTFCLDCHQNQAGGKSPVYWGAYYPTPSSRFSSTHQYEPHGFNRANMSGDFPCGYWCDSGAPCINMVSDDLDAAHPFYNKPQGRGNQIWTLSPYNMEDKMAGINFVLVCTDCHEPHGSKRRSLLRDHINGNNINEGGSLNVCTSCHWPFGGVMTPTTQDCGDGPPASCSTTGCHGSVSLHRLANNNLTHSTVLRDPEKTGESYESVLACSDNGRGIIGLWSGQGSDGSGNDADVIYSNGAYINGILETRDGGNFRTKRRECHSLRYPDTKWDSGAASEATQFTYEGKVKFYPYGATNAVDPEDSIEQSLIDYTLGGAGTNWAVRLSNRCCTPDNDSDGIADGDPSGDLYLQVMINVWDQDQANPWRIAYSKVPFPVGGSGHSGLVSVAAKFDASDPVAPLRVYINGADVTDGIGGVWVHDPAVYNPAVATMYNQPVGMHINTYRHEDDCVTGDPSGAPDGACVAGWDDKNRNPYIHFGVDAQVCRPKCTNVAGRHNFWGYMGKQRLSNMALTADQICSNVINMPGDTDWDMTIYNTNIAGDCSYP